MIFPASSARANDNKEVREKLAVLDLVAKWGVEPGFAEALSVFVRDEIHRFGKYEVMSREDIAAVATREAMLQAMGCDESGACLVDFGRNIGTRFMVAGSVSKLGATYSISLRMLDTRKENGGVVNRVSGGCKCSIDDFIETVHEVAAKLVGEKAVSAVQTKKSAGPERNTEKLKQEDRVPAVRQERKIEKAGIGSGSGFIDPVTGMEFVRVKGGCFQMGSPSTEKNRDNDEGPLHDVCVDDFFMGKFEVTVGQWKEFIRSSGYRTDAERNIRKKGCRTYKDGSWDWRLNRYWKDVGFFQTDRQPAVCISFNDVEKFIDWLRREGGPGYRLPTEAEWEYAARSGNAAARFWGKLFENSESTACKYANIADAGHGWKCGFPCDDGFRNSSPVGSFLANGFGLFDMLGNVWEWTGDWYGKNYYKTSPRDNPSGPKTGKGRVVRGGDWGFRPVYARAANRGRRHPWQRSVNMGFRLVFVQE